MSDSPARYVMIGGFLGAGKTTAVDRFARHLTERELRVGLITNDQSTGLVDTAVLRSRGWAVEEISGGCFCCRFPSLQDAATRLTEQSRPDVILAEPVGSCTDLLATVSYPLRRIYGDRFSIAPLSVMVDPIRAARVLGLAEGRSFSEKVIYVYRKQLEEADLIVVNKAETLTDDSRDRLVSRLAEEFPRAEVLTASAKEGDGLESWFTRIMEREITPRQTMELDYDTYAEGEAQLGWLNATVAVTSKAPFNGNELLIRLTDELRQRIADGDGEVAHLKMTLDSPGATDQLAVVSVVTNEGEPDLRESLFDQVSGGQLIINLRAEMDPESLAALVKEVLAANAENGLSLTLEHEERFRPGRPVPTHRERVGADEEAS